MHDCPIDEGALAHADDSALIRMEEVLSLPAGLFYRAPGLGRLLTHAINVP